MEIGSRLRVIIISVIAIVLLILTTWGIISLARNIFKGSKKGDSTSSVQKIEISDYDRSGTAARLNVDGPIVGDEQFVSYQIEVTQSYRKLSTYKGYQKVLVSEKRYNNNAEAYRTFLHALQRVNYTTGIAGASDDETAACATGRRYVYSLVDQEETTSRLWNTSCTNKIGSILSTNAALIRSLYKAQIPDYSTILVKEFSTLK